MRILFICILLFLSKGIYSQKSTLLADSVVIKFAPWDIITDIGVECMNFESFIDYRICTESNYRTIRRLSRELDRLKISSKGGEDIRCKLEFYRSGEICRLDCVGNILTHRGTDYYYTTPKLKKIINQIIKKQSNRIRTGTKGGWDPNPSIQKFYRYLHNHSERLYDNITIDHDLDFMIFCNVSEGKTVNVRFTNDNSKKGMPVPTQITNIIKDILFHEIEWDTPPHHQTQWIQFNIKIRSNITQE